jgi:hypothetical protein
LAKASSWADHDRLIAAQKDLETALLDRSLEPTDDRQPTPAKVECQVEGRKNQVGRRVD